MQCLCSPKSHGQNDIKKNMLSCLIFFGKSNTFNCHATFILLSYPLLEYDVSQGSPARARSREARRNSDDACLHIPTYWGRGHSRLRQCVLAQGHVRRGSTAAADSCWAEKREESEEKKMELVVALAGGGSLAAQR